MTHPRTGIVPKRHRVTSLLYESILGGFCLAISVRQRHKYVCFCYTSFHLEELMSKSLVLAIAMRGCKEHRIFSGIMIGAG